MVAVVAADKDGLKAGQESGRIRLHRLRGEAALAYECDVAIMMNPEQITRAGSHAVCLGGEDPDWVIFAVEKNRTGPADVDAMYQRWGAQFRFDPVG